LPAHTSYFTGVPENQTIFLILNIFPKTNSHRKAICRQEQRSKTATTAQISKSLPFQVKKGSAICCWGRGSAVFSTAKESKSAGVERAG
jgi:hypothetical protein